MVVLVDRRNQHHHRLDCGNTIWPSTLVFNIRVFTHRHCGGHSADIPDAFYSAHLDRERDHLENGWGVSCLLTNYLCAYAHIYPTFNGVFHMIDLPSLLVILFVYGVCFWKLWPRDPKAVGAPD